jgi:hypothetical protein
MKFDWAAARKSMQGWKLANLQELKACGAYDRALKRVEETIIFRVKQIARSRVQQIDLSSVQEIIRNGEACKTSRAEIAEEIWRDAVGYAVREIAIRLGGPIQR